MVDEIAPYVHFNMGSWLENAGIVGISRVLGINCSKTDKQLSVPTDQLNDFSEKYFKYFSSDDKFGKLTRFYKILTFRPRIESWQHDHFNNFGENELKLLQDWYKNILKHSVNSNSYKRVYQLIESNIDPVTKTKKVGTELRQLGRKHFLENHQDEAIQLLNSVSNKLLELIDYFDRPDSHKYFPAKTLCYTIINNAWNGVSFLNPQTKFVDFYADYQQAFVDPVINYIKSDHKKDKFRCSTCGRPIHKENSSNAYSFINGMGYDVNRKTSNAWNFNNDQFICPICRLMYSCVSAGFNYNMTKQGIFINYNRSLNELIKANDGIELTMIQGMNDYGNQFSPFRAFTMSFESRLAQSSKYNLADIQLVSFNSDHYLFTIIPTVAAKVITKAIKKPFGKKTEGRNCLSVLYNTGIQNFRGKDYYNIYDEVVRRLLNSTNLTSLIYEMELLMNSQTPDLKFNHLHLMALININVLFFKNLEKNREASIMEVTSENLKKMRGAGMHVLQYYQEYENGNKATSLVYKLLQAIDSNNPERFMEILLNVYADQHRLVPSKLVNNINHPEVFQQYGLAFIAGLIAEKQK